MQGSYNTHSSGSVFLAKAALPRQAAESAKAETLAGMSVTATISFDRQSMMGNMGRPDSGEFDKEQFEAMMGGASSLTLEEYETYAQATSVQSFYYTLTVSVDGNDDFSPVTTSSESSGSSAGTSIGGGDFEDMGKNPFTNYITEVNSAMNLTVVLQMIGIGLLLTLVAGAVAILFIMRYNPLKILDTDTQQEIIDIFRKLADEGKCVLLVSHSPDVAKLCDERYELVKISKKSKR